MKNIENLKLNLCNYFQNFPDFSITLNFQLCEVITFFGTYLE